GDGFGQSHGNLLGWNGGSCPNGQGPLGQWKARNTGRIVGILHRRRWTFARGMRSERVDQRGRNRAVALKTVATWACRRQRRQASLPFWFQVLPLSHPPWT